MKRKLNFGFFTLILLVLAICSYALVSNWQMREVFVEMKGDIIPGAIAMTEIEKDAIELGHELLHYIISGKHENKENALETLKDLIEKIQKHIEHGMHMGLIEQKAATEISKKTKDLTSSVMDLLTLKKQGSITDEVLETESETIQMAIHSLIEQTKALKAIHMSELASAGAGILKKHDTVIKNVMILGILAIILAVIIGLLIDKLFTKYVHERKEAEKSLRQSEEKYFSLLESNPDPIIVYDKEGEVVYFNPEFTHVFGWKLDECLGEKMNLFVPEKNWPETRMMIDKVSAEKKFSGIESIRYTKAGHSVPVSISGSVHRIKGGKSIGAVVNLRDITEQKKLEAQFQQAQKMEAIGVLAGGVAHDFNNLLTIIMVNADIALTDVGTDDSMREAIEEIKTAGKRGADLVRQLLAFSRKQIIQPKVLDLNNLLTGIEKMLVRLIGENIEILKILGPALWKVEIDPGQMEQVVMNLAINARDAMPIGGNLTIETDNMDIDETYLYRHGIKDRPGPFVMLAVSDTGKGIDKETQKHIFEPFYTTKERGKGTGLGLSTVYGIVKQNNGFVWIYSEPGLGSTFKIYLPKAKQDVVSEQKEQSLETERGGSETILLVEDDNNLRELTRTLINQNGYKVIVAENGEDALRVSKEHEEQIDLLLTDVIMPRMGGRETAKRLQPLRPQMKTLYMSGYTDDAIVHHGVLAEGMNFLQKPFSHKDLACKIREVLDKKQD